MEEEKIDLGIFPIENSNGGIVYEAVQAMSKHLFNIKKIFEIDIRHCLITGHESGGLSVVQTSKNNDHREFLTGSPHKTEIRNIVSSNEYVLTVSQDSCALWRDSNSVNDEDQDFQSPYDTNHQPHKSYNDASLTLVRSLSGDLRQASFVYPQSSRTPNTVS